MPMLGVSHALLRGCIVVIWLIYASGVLFAGGRRAEVDSGVQVDQYIVDDEPSAYVLLWSYFSSLAASSSSEQHD